MQWRTRTLTKDLHMMLEVKENKHETVKNKARAGIGECIQTQSVMGGFISKSETPSNSVSTPAEVQTATVSVASSESLPVSSDAQESEQNHPKTILKDFTEELDVSDGTNTPWHYPEKGKSFEDEISSSKKIIQKEIVPLLSVDSNDFTYSDAFIHKNCVTSMNAEMPVESQSILPVSNSTCHVIKSSSETGGRGLCTAEQRTTGPEPVVLGPQTEVEQNSQEVMSAYTMSVEPKDKLRRKPGRPPKKRLKILQADERAEYNCDESIPDEKHITTRFSLSQEEEFAKCTRDGTSHGALSTDFSINEPPDKTEPTIVTTALLNKVLQPNTGEASFPLSSPENNSDGVQLKVVTDSERVQLKEEAAPYNSVSEIKTSEHVLLLPKQGASAHPHKKWRKRRRGRCPSKQVSKPYTEVAEKNCTPAVSNSALNVKNEGGNNQDHEAQQFKSSNNRDEVFPKKLCSYNEVKRESDATVSLKRKVGRPPKKKTLPLAGERASPEQKLKRSTTDSPVNHKVHQSPSLNLVKRKSETPPLQIGVSRCYTRACKANKNNKVQHLGHKSKQTSPSSSSSNAGSPQIRVDIMTSPSTVMSSSSGKTVRRVRKRKHIEIHSESEESSLHVKLSSIKGLISNSKTSSVACNLKLRPENDDLNFTRKRNRDLLKVVPKSEGVLSPVIPEETEKLVMNSQHCTNSQLNPGADSTPALSSTRQKRGRPQKKELVSPDLKTVGTMKEIDHYSFPTEANGPASSTYTTIAKTASVPAGVALRRPCKIDRRRKRFRKMKAMEMERLTEKEKVSSLCQDPLSGVGHISTNSTLVKFEPDHNAEKATSLIQQVSTSRKTTYGNRKRHKTKRSVWKRKRIVQDTQLKVHQDTAVKQMCENKESVNNSKDFPVEKERASAESIDTYEHDSLSSQKTQSMLPVHVLQTRTMKVEFTDGNPPCDDISVENEKLLHNVTVNLQPEYCRDDQLAKTNVDQDVQVKLKEMPCILNIKSSKRMKEEGVFLQNTLTDFSKAVKETGETTSKDSCCKPLNNEDKQEHVVVVGQRNQHLKLKDSHSSDISSDEVLAENSNVDCNGSLSRGRPRKEKKPIKCEYCDRLFNHLSPYIIHRRIHTGEKPFSCQECGRSFAQLSNLRSHYKVHKGSSKQHFRYSNKSNKFPLQRDNQRQSKLHATGSSKQLRTVENFDSDCFVTPDNTSPKKGKVQVCPYCGKAFRFRSVLNIHLRVHSGEKPYLCRVCGKGFTQACSVRIHERIHWSVKPFLCSKCGKGFSQIGTLKGHTCHGNKQIHSTLKDMEVSGAVTFRCHLCKECFDHRHAYELHLQTHTDIQRYTCDVCGEKYSLLSELNAHQNFCLNMKILDTKPDHSEPVVKPQVNSQHLPHTQSICAAVKLETPQPKKHSNQFLTPLSLRSHSIQPQRHKKYLSLLSCPIKKMVTSVYDSQYNFKHQPFKNGRFVSQLNSVDQKSDPRKYFCPRCGRLFRHVGRLRAHMLTHARGQSYTCGCCGKTLENWSKFWRHQRIHRQKHGRFFCPTCGQGFRFVGVYEKHLQEHPELNAYFCPICPHTFSSAKRLRDHQVEWHGACMPYICDICGKGFRSPVILERHKVAHRQILSQMDNFCEVEVRPSAVPYQCGKCDSSFKTLDLLFHHQILHPCRSRQSDGSNHCTRNQDLHQAAHSSASTCEPTGYNPQCVKDCPSTLPSDRTNNKPLKVRSQSKHANLPHHLLLSETVFLHPMHRQKNLSAQNTIDADTPLWSDAHFDPHSQSKEVQDVNKLQCTGSAVHTNYQVSVEPSPRDLSAVTDKMEERTEVVGCTECNATFTAIPLLFQHYLQHAREEV